MGELGGDVAAGGERGVALVEGQLLSVVRERHTRGNLTQCRELHASGHVHEVHRGCQHWRLEPLGYLPPSDIRGREDGVRRTEKV